ncbi:MAG: 4Fe-4S dicluster domain-containing protein [Deltaproteobacteria bacterium]|nr:4Fe-4S dicluster domain-containing protein [Deltaproteobacteria bacterium]
MATINLDRADPDFRRELAGQPGAEKIAACFQCRTCVASCPIAEVNDAFNPLRIIRMALYGLRKEVLESDWIWFCSSCYSCQERCPQGVRITEFMTVLKNMAIREGNIPPGVKAQRDIITGEGKIYPLDDFDNKKREKAGLPPLPTTCEAVKELFPQ